MFSMPELSSPVLRFLHDVGTMLLLALALVPLYLLFNHYWQSLIVLLVLYGLLGLGCLRLGSFFRRTIRRLPAELPPWSRAATRAAVSADDLRTHHRSAEAICGVRKDPRYVQVVFKARLRELIAYRLSGKRDTPFEALEPAQLAQLDAVLLHFLQRQEETSLWARYSQRRHRVSDALEILRRVEAL